MTVHCPRDLDFGRLPLDLVENRGQTDARVVYYLLAGAKRARIEPGRGGGH
jgi:hypothetical protein